jgi:DNA modification methylase
MFVTTRGHFAMIILEAQNIPADLIEFFEDLDEEAKPDVFNVATKSYNGAHFAVFPPELITPCVLAGSREGDTVFDPFMGSGTTAAVALKYGRNYLGCELNQNYKELQTERMKVQTELFAVAV